jgi:hypothetical protein
MNLYGQKAKSEGSALLDLVLEWAGLLLLPRRPLPRGHLQVAHQRRHGAALYDYVHNLLCKQKQQADPPQ